jgi:8-oxo-dGTP diphosphatase
MTEYRNPKPTVDIIIELPDDQIVLIERTHEPLGFAIPGGFVDEFEWLADAAVREAKEETCLDIEVVELFHAYSNPKRDKRMHTVSTVFIAKASGTPVGADDAARAFACKIDALPKDLVFDHDVILGDYLIYKRTGKRPPARR